MWCNAAQFYDRGKAGCTADARFAAGRCAWQLRCMENKSAIFYDMCVFRIIAVFSPNIIADIIRYWKGRDLLWKLFWL